ncbi:hypothetical protein WL80_01295 [Burkholderia ubonensis]|uniref:AbiTii domain-containing protein n=1 Tax=Burkholderia ubonensis TaxID=101571 RepID=UPI00075BBBF3|nr:hypothetical protein [Burkholderia ubonensis]KVZ09032.1 hypothetical protein WL11_07510 [Burkholderia ubonensis]KWE90384.1 hypothetical protein WL80_01295 [Burkholderia ubonensis]
MKLFDEILTLLSDEQGSLTNALLKTRLLMHRIGHKDIDVWLSAELNGYGKTGNIPPYRVVKADIYGTVENIAKRYTNVPIPVAHLPQAFHDAFVHVQMGHSVKVLSELAESTEGSVGTSIPPELYGTLSKSFDGFSVTSARSLIGTTQVAGILIEIRSRLLEFVLGLHDQIGDVPEEELKNAASDINANDLFRSAIIGENATIIVGNHNTTSISNTVTKGDIGQLKKKLADGGVDADDLVALDRAIDEDGDVPHAEKKLGPKVARWVGSMMQKAAEGGLKIGIAEAGKLLSGAIFSYYGLPSS